LAVSKVIIRIMAVLYGTELGSVTLKINNQQRVGLYLFLLGSVGTKEWN